MDIFEHIKKDHKDADAVMQEMAQNFDVQLFEKLSLMLTAHMEAEERTLYSAMRSQEAKMIKQSTDEHRQIKEALDQLDRDRGKEDLQNTLSRLALLVKDHVDKEESEVLPTAKDLFDDDEVSELSKRFDEIDQK